MKIKFQSRSFLNSRIWIKKKYIYMNKLIYRIFFECTNVHKTLFCQFKANIKDEDNFYVKIIISF
jgi:hypothetical protein